MATEDSSVPSDASEGPQGRSQAARIEALELALALTLRTLDSTAINGMKHRRALRRALQLLEGSGDDT